jgi:hypothetical protein
MDAIVTAGGIPQPDEPLYSYSHGDPKALIDVAGKPMVQWVLDALSDAKQVDNVVMVGLSPKSGLSCTKPVHYVSNQGRMLANIVAGVNKCLELDPRAKYVLIVSADIPALRGDMVDWLVNTAMETKDDLYYGICPREVMEARFPGSNRTYTRLKDIDLCGADINISHVRMATEHLDLWESLIGNRKSPLRQAATIGFDTLFQVATHSITLQQLVEKVCRRIHIQGRAIVWDRAEPCMDVDKPHQLELLREDLARQERGDSSGSKKAAPKKTVQAKPAESRSRKGLKPKTSAKKEASSLPATKAKAKAR